MTPVVCNMPKNPAVQCARRAINFPPQPRCENIFQPRSRINRFCSGSCRKADESEEAKQKTLKRKRYIRQFKTILFDGRSSGRLLQHVPKEVSRRTPSVLWIDPEDVLDMDAHRARCLAEREEARLRELESQD